MKIALLPALMCVVFCMSGALAQSPERLANDNSTQSGFQNSYSDNAWDYFLYPVPAVDEINVKVTKGHVSIHQINITDEFGNDLLEMIDLASEKIKVDISDLPEGKYFMQIIANDKKLVKMKRFYISK